eukprot:scaffold764_cov248-Pinguiococcus_pyrenoidosus.AAC.29
MALAWTRSAALSRKLCCESKLLDTEPCSGFEPYNSPLTPWHTHSRRPAHQCSLLAAPWTPCAASPLALTRSSAVLSRARMRKGPAEKISAHLPRCWRGQPPLETRVPRQGPSLDEALEEAQIVPKLAKGTHVFVLLVNRRIGGIAVSQADFSEVGRQPEVPNVNLQGQYALHIPARQTRSELLPVHRLGRLCGRRLLAHDGKRTVLVSGPPELHQWRATVAWSRRMGVDSWEQRAEHFHTGTQRDFVQKPVALPPHAVIKMAKVIEVYPQLPDLLPLR